MTAATNSALGEIKLAGDLAGSNDATAPELSTVLSTPGAFGIAKPTVDAKGRVTAISNASPADVALLVPDATATKKGLVKIGTNISLNNSAVPGYQTIDFDGVLTATTASGLCNNGATYSFKLARDGASPITVTLAASSLTQIQDLINEVNAVITPFSLVLVAGNLQITSNTTGVTSSVLISEDKLFQYMAGYLSIESPVNGMGDSTIYIPDASATVKGVAKFRASDFTVSSGAVSMKEIADATTTSKGLVQIGSGLDVSDGVISATPIPDATTSTKGLVQIGSGIDVTDGVISVPTATSSVQGLVQVGANLSVTSGVLTTTFGDATSSAHGVVQVGSGIDVTNGVISIPLASTTNLGIVQVGTGLQIDGSGVLSLVSPLPTASTTQAGLVQIGSGLDVSDGVISATPIPDATTSTKGLVQIGSNLAVSSGVVSASFPDATTVVKGLVQIGSGLDVTGGVVSLAAIPDATTTSKGYVQVGTNLAVSDGVISASLPDATTTSKGLVQIGSGLSVTGGVISADSAVDATTTSKGLVQIGTNLSVSSGVISASYPDATSSTPGLVTIGSGLSANSGVVSIADATTSSKGVVQIGANLTVTSGVVSAPTATSSTLGVVTSNDTTSLTISSGLIDVGSNIPKKNTANTFTKAQVTALVAGGNTGTATVTPNFSNGNVFFYTATGNFTLAAPTNVVAGGTYMIIIKQDAIGSRACTFNNAYKFGTGAISALSTTANKYDIISIVAQASGVLLTTTQLGF